VQEIARLKGPGGIRRDARREAQILGRVASRAERSAGHSAAEVRELFRALLAISLRLQRRSVQRTAPARDDVAAGFRERHG
jgi:chorismate mutase